MPKGGGRLFACKFCGSTLEDQTTPKERETGSYPRLVIHTTTSVTAAQPLTPAQSKRAKRLSWFLIIVIVGPVLVGVIVTLYVSGVLAFGGQDLVAKVSSRRIYNYGVSKLLPSDNDTRPDVIAVARYADETKRMVYVDFDSDPALRWVSEHLGEGSDYLNNATTHNHTHVYLAHETTLTALDRGYGTITWQAYLSDEISNSCQDCLQVYGDILVALTSDGQLSGFDPQTGGTIWNLRLVKTPRQLMNLAGRVGVLDEENDDVGIHVYTPESGNLLQRMVPTCPNDVFPGSPQTLGIYDPVFISSDGERMYVPIHGYDPGCIQYWDAASLTHIWEKTIPNEVLDGLDWGSHLFTDEALYTSDGPNLFAIHLEDGGYGKAFSAPDYDLTPIGAQAGVVLVWAERTRGTTQHSLLGIDPGSMTKLWEFNPTAEEIDETGSNVVHDEGIWYANAIPDKVAIFEAFRDPAYAIITVLNPLDGSSVSSNSVPFDDSSSSYWLQILGWHEDRMYVVTDNQIRLIDGDTGEQLGVWP
jgi:outer membrane protein assembly factor BamB